MDEMPCITCKCNLRDVGRPSPDWQWANCTVCGAVYLIRPAVNEYGLPMVTQDGRTMLYLEPVKPGNPSMYREDAAEMPPVEHVDADARDEEFNALKDTIENCVSVNDFLKKLKTK